VSRNRALVTALLFFAALFIVVGALQYLFIRYEIRATVSQQLGDWADDLRESLIQNGKVDLTALRHAAPKASDFIILAPDGTFIATHGFVQGSVSYAGLPAGSSYDRPVLVQSSLGEQWHLLAKKIKGGSVILGASAIDSPPDIDARLINSAKQFGDSVDAAEFSSSHDKDENVDFAVLEDDGILLNDSGGIPLKAKKQGLLLRADQPIVTVSGNTYFVSKTAVIDRAKHTVATIVVMRDIDLEEEMLRKSAVFNVSVAAVSLLLCGFVLVLDFSRIRE
jgi:hypothetical protein